MAELNLSFLYGIYGSEHCAHTENNVTLARNAKVLLQREKKENESIKDIE